VANRCSASKTSTRMDLPLVFEKLGIALGLGLLVGLQRERVRTSLGGIRTFPLTTVLGTICGLLADQTPWIIAAGFVGLALLLAVAHLTRDEEDEPPGMTTEVAALVMFGVGAYLIDGYTEVALAIGGGVAVLLHFKAPMHELVARIGEEDLKAIMQLVLVALV